jgi:hypothetical protein
MDPSVEASQLDGAVRRGDEGADLEDLVTVGVEATGLEVEEEEVGCVVWRVGCVV